jgi:hypothetical protein
MNEPATVSSHTSAGDLAVLVRTVVYLEENGYADGVRYHDA